MENLSGQHVGSKQAMFLDLVTPAPDLCFKKSGMHSRDSTCSRRLVVEETPNLQVCVVLLLPGRPCTDSLWNPELYPSRVKSTQCFVRRRLAAWKLSSLVGCENVLDSEC